MHMGDHPTVAAMDMMDLKDRAAILSTFSLHFIDDLQTPNEVLRSCRALSACS
jgi:hypothetical protein